MDLSIIIPVYNAAEFIKPCIDSIVCAGYPEFEYECILIDDGSKDDSATICKDLVQHRSNFSYFYKENGGVSSARNYGLKQAKGKYILFLDADDMLTENGLDKIADGVRNHNAEFMAFNYITLYSEGKQKEEHFAFDGDRTTDIEKARELMYASSQFNACWGKLFCADIIKRNKLEFPEELHIGEDLVFVAAYFKCCQTVYVTQEPVLFYRQHPGSSMRKYNLTQRLEYTQILYDKNKMDVTAIGNVKLLQKMYNYYIRVLTNLFLEFSKRSSILKLRRDYKAAFEVNCVREFVEKSQVSSMPGYKKMECMLLKKRCFLLLSVYFKLKSSYPF